MTVDNLGDFDNLDPTTVGRVVLDSDGLRQPGDILLRRECHAPHASASGPASKTSKLCSDTNEILD